MNKTNLSSEIFSILVILGMFIASAVVWPSVSEPMPTHWNIQGEPDRYGGKFEGLLLMPLIALGVYWLSWLVRFIDPGRANDTLFHSAFNAIRISVIGFLAVIHATMIMAGMGYVTHTNTIVLASVGLLFMILGKYMSKIRPNWFIGVRTPWTLSSRQSWNKTHRLASWLFVVMGLMFVIAAFLGNQLVFNGVFGITITMVVFLFVYSWWVWKNDPHSVAPAATTPASPED